MGLSNIPNVGEGVVPVLVLNTVLSVGVGVGVGLRVLKNMSRSVLEAVGVTSSSSYSPNTEEEEESDEFPGAGSRRRRISITQYKCIGTTLECCLCLCGFEANQEVSELACKHFFHTPCLNKWFHNKHTTCPLCRFIH